MTHTLHIGHTFNTARQAACSLVVQISTREIYHLIKNLERWPEIEVQFFLADIMAACMSDVQR